MACVHARPSWQARGNGGHGFAAGAVFRRVGGFFLGLQADYDLMQRRRQIGADLAAITRL
jgi:hypothetical protein